MSTCKDLPLQIYIVMVLEKVFKFSKNFTFLSSNENYDWNSTTKHLYLTPRRNPPVNVVFCFCKGENFVGTSKQRHAYIFSQFLKIKPAEKNIDDMADMLGQSEILEPDAKKRLNSARQKNSKSDKN